MQQSITVAIVTRNRAKDLQECLLSLVRQTLRPDAVLIINNNSKDNTHGIISSFTDVLKIREIVEKSVGYPSVYNRALAETKTKWVAFIDDDCVADPGWYSEIVTSTARHREYAAIAGSSYNYYPTNVFACVFQLSGEYWRSRSIDITRVLDFRTLDSRNIVYNKELLVRHKIQFDAAFVYGAEDGDVGFQIQRHKLKAAFASKAIVFHKEPRTLTQFFRKKIAYARSFRLFTQKWGGQKAPTHKRSRCILMWETFQRATQKQSPAGKLGTALLAVADYLLSRYRLYELLSYMV